MRPSIATALIVLLSAGAAGAAPKMARVQGGTYTPVFPPSPEETTIPVATFLLDERPVTNGEFLGFVQKAPRWRSDRIAGLFAGKGYLSHWSGPTSLGAAAPADAPVVQVSWFAAKAYCEAQGKRLPTESEWEYAASASADQADARQDPAFVAQLLAWYGKPNAKVLPAAGRSAPNFYGVRDMHGLVWEWVGDFNSALVSGDSREDGDPDTARFCGAGALSAADKNDYATFMRVAFRSSLQASYTTANLGFRCARDAGAAKEK
jgi:formylglycine-generating enzyme required for sulfatase activity